MKLTLETIKYENKYDNDSETHRVLLDGISYMSQSESIAIEDVRFYRDLTSPHTCRKLIEEIVSRIKSGEELEIIEDTVNGNLYD